MKPKLMLPVAVAGLAVVLSACGSGSPAAGSSQTSTPPAAGTSAAAPTGAADANAASADQVKWVGAVCTGVGSSMSALVKMVSGGNPEAKPPAEQKALVLAYLDEVSGGLEKGGAQLKQLGAPAGAGMDTAHQELVAAFEASSKGLAAQKKQVVALDPKDPQFTKKLEGVQGANDVDPKQLKAKLDGALKKPEMGAAAKTAPECIKMGEAAKEFGKAIGVAPKPTGGN